MTDYRLLDAAMIVVQAGKSINDETATRIEIVDDGGGPYLEVSQDNGAVRIDPDEWPSIKQAIDRMIGAAAVIEQEHGHD